jgi:broad specificity phosphatase PhoE
MSGEREWRIPPSTLTWLEQIPAHRPIALLLRHSVRGPLPTDSDGHAVPLTEAGVHLARELGRVMGARLRGLHSSPLVRCMQTASALAEGAGVNLPITADHLLGDPGVFVLDGQRAWVNWQKLGHESVVAHLVSADNALPGMARPAPAARFLVQHMLAVSHGSPGIHVFVTHDSLVTATAARLLGQALTPEDWPGYLEGVFFWPEQEGLNAAYRDHARAGIALPLCGLNQEDVVEFARREIARVVGLDSQAHFFLAGGAFKTLLTGKPPRDLDLWAVSAKDRDKLIAALIARGARRLPERPFAEAFSIAGRTVEVPYAVEPATLAERLARFDIALSAIGVEHHPDARWTARIHPSAQVCVQSRQVLLLKPLVNWKYALTTLERIRRYAAELGFELPPEEEAEIWRIFAAQSPEMRTGMLERFARTRTGQSNPSASSGQVIIEEALWRFP